MTEIEICKGFKTAKDKASYIAGISKSEKISAQEVLQILTKYGLISKTDKRYTDLINKVATRQKSQPTIINYSAARVINSAKQNHAVTKRKNLTASDIAKSGSLIKLIKDHLDMGLSANEIAGMLGVDDVQIIYKACKAAGISISEIKSYNRTYRHVREQLSKILNLNEYMESYIEMGSKDYALRVVKEQREIILSLMRDLKQSGG